MGISCVTRFIGRKEEDKNWAGSKFHESGFRIKIRRKWRHLAPAQFTIIEFLAFVSGLHFPDGTGSGGFENRISGFDGTGTGSQYDSQTGGGSGYAYTTSCLVKGKWDMANFRALFLRGAHHCFACQHRAHKGVIYRPGWQRQVCQSLRAKLAIAWLGPSMACWDTEWFTHFVSVLLLWPF